MPRFPMLRLMRLSLHIAKSKSKALPAYVTLSILFTVSLISLHFPPVIEVGELQVITPVEHVPRIRKFSQNDVIECIDSLGAQSRARKFQPSKNLASTDEVPLHIAFAGDSRIRQHFFSFLQALPQNDLIASPKAADLHLDRTVTSKMLNLLVTFSWRPNILGKAGDNTTETLSRWILTPHLSRKPDILLLGMALHDMLPENGADHELYGTRLLKLRPLLEELNKGSRVLWLSVYPTFDTATYGWKNNLMYTEKISRYNAIAREVFRDTDIYYWESSTPLTEEYIRSCTFNLRSAGYLWGNTPYSNCGDYLHPGNVAMSEATQMFLGEICNVI